MEARASPDSESSPSGLFAQTVPLALWAGAAGLFSIVVARAAFAVLPTRELAGALVGGILPAVFIMGMVAAIAAIALELAAPTRRLRVARLVSSGAILVACAIAQFGIAPRIAALRASLPGPLAEMALDAPERVAFGRLHMLSVAWLGVGMAGAVTGLVLCGVCVARRRSS